MRNFPKKAIFTSHSDVVFDEYEYSILRDLIESCGVENPEHISREILSRFESLSIFVNNIESIDNFIEDENIKKILINMNNLYSYISRSRLSDRNIFKNWNELIDFCRFTTAFKLNQQMHAIYMHSNYRFIGHEAIQSGTIHDIKIYNREIIRKTLRVGATKLLLFKNIPNGEISPSNMDYELFHNIKRTCELVQIYLIDVLLIAPKGEISILNSLKILPDFFDKNRN